MIEFLPLNHTCGKHILSFEDMNSGQRFEKKTVEKMEILISNTGETFGLLTIAARLGSSDTRVGADKSGKWCYIHIKYDILLNYKRTALDVRFHTAFVFFFYQNIRTLLYVIVMKHFVFLAVFFRICNDIWCPANKETFPLMHQCRNGKKITRAKYVKRSVVGTIFLWVSSISLITVCNQSRKKKREQEVWFGIEARTNRRR